MLYIEAIPYSKTEDLETILVHPGAEFNAAYEDSWLDDKWSRRVISDIQRFDVTDQSKSVREHLRSHGMEPEDLAGGTKNLLVTRFSPDGRKTRIAMMGENCYKWLMDIADMQDVFAVVTTPVFFKTGDLKGRPVTFVNTGASVSTQRAFFDAMLDIDGSGVFRY